MTSTDLDRLLAAWRGSDDLFALLPKDVMLERPIALRHPFLFYLGHLPAFAWNQIGRGVLGLGDLDPELDVLSSAASTQSVWTVSTRPRDPAWPAIDASGCLPRPGSGDPPSTSSRSSPGARRAIPWPGTGASCRWRSSTS